MYELPTTITVDDTQFHITNRGDYRMVLDCFDALNDEEMGEDLRVLASVIIFYEEIDDLEDIKRYESYLEQLIAKMYEFFNCNQSSIGATVQQPVIFWSEDSQILCAAVNSVANQEIRSLEYLHWWTFMGYFQSIGESVFSTVVSIRDKLNRGKPLEKWEKEFKRSNQNYFISKEDKELETLLNSLRDGGD